MAIRAPPSRDALAERKRLRHSASIYLTGYRGTGKTSVGAVLAERLALPLIDLDEAIERAAGRTIRQIFATGGEEAFREAEAACLAEVACGPRAVVALGGGAILRPANRQRIRSSGLCVWLDADAETLARRLVADATTAERRPALTQLGQRDEIERLLEVRRPLYREAAEHRVETAGKTIEQVAEDILRLLDQSE